MTKSATEVMQEIVFSAVIDSIAALKAASKGLPNTLLRDINAVHANTTFADLPPELQAALSASVRAAFARLLKEGYSVAPARPEPRREGPPRGERVERGEQRRPPRRPAPRRDGPGRGERPRQGPRPPRKPSPR
jgi:hypothetical protein